MDVTEVINPQFAFPVFGVVLCAVLVFAFGFRSSVQPPSFIFEDEKKQKKAQKKPKKLQNGHIGNDLTNGPPSTGSSPKQQKQSSGNKQPAEKNESTRSRKKPATPKTPAKVERETKAEPAKEQEKQDTGDWIPALSRKERKMRGKKDDRPDRYGDDGLSDEPQSDSTTASPKSREPVPESTPEVGPGGDNAEAKKPMDQRTARKDRKKKNAESKTNDAAAVGKPVVTATSVAVAAAAAAKDEKEEKRSEEATATPIKKQQKPIPTPTEEKTETSKADSSPEKKSPKKKKKRSTRLPEQVEGGAQPEAAESSVPLEPSDVVGETTVPDAAAAIAEAMQESHDVESQDTQSAKQSETATASSADSKPGRSPKKKKKTKDREKEKPQTVSESRGEASQTRDLADSSVHSAESRVAASTTPVSQTQPQTQGAAVERLNTPSKEESSSAAQAGAASTKPSTSSEDQSKVNFDELGDWQEAKPVKKKKKARREN